MASFEGWDAYSGELGELIALDLREACGDRGAFSIPRFYKVLWRQLMKAFGLSDEAPPCESEVVQFLKSAAPSVLWLFNMHVVPSDARMRLQGLNQGNHRSVVFYESEFEFQ